MRSSSSSKVRNPVSRSTPSTAPPQLALQPAETPYGRVLTFLMDGDVAWKLECPGCGKWAQIDDDQLHGRVSVDHTDTGCTYHETHDFAAEIAKGGPEVPRGLIR